MMFGSNADGRLGLGAGVESKLVPTEVADIRVRPVDPNETKDEKKKREEEEAKAAAAGPSGGGAGGGGGAAAGEGSS